MQRNGFFVPKLKSGFCNFDYLNGVRFGQLYCPKYSELKLRACPKPASKREIITELLMIISGDRDKKGIGFDLNSKTFPDK